MTTLAARPRARTAASVRSWRALPGAASPWAGLVAGTLLVVWSYRLAAARPDADMAHFGFFWAGELAFVLPAFARLAGPRASSHERLALVAAAALSSFLPKVLRGSAFPIFHDELVHIRELHAILATGAPFQPSPVISVIQFFPGLHVFTASLLRLSGSDAYVLVVIILAVLHVAGAAGIYVIAERLLASGRLHRTDFVSVDVIEQRLLRSTRVPALAAFIYTLNPSSMFFDAQFAYESLAIVFFIWVLAALAASEASLVDGAQRAWIALALLLAAALVTTHHVSAYYLAAVLLCASVTHVVARSLRARGRAVALFLLVFAGMAVGWAALVASNVFAYLAPHFAGAFGQLMTLIARDQGSRTLFQASPTPPWEHWAGFLAPVAMLAVSAAGFAVTRRTLARTVVCTAVLLMAGSYAASLPLMLTSAGSEGARRTWAFSYVGLALLAAIAVDVAMTRASRPVVRRVLPAAAGVLAWLVLMGNVADGLDAYNRFPGPVTARSSARALTGEVRAGALWFLSRAGRNQRVITDTYTALAFASFADAWVATPSRGFPTWQLFLSSRPSRRLVGDLQQSHFNWLVVNDAIPLAPRYFMTADLSTSAIPERRTTTVPSSRFDRTTWLTPVYASERIHIYSINYPRLWASIAAPGARR